MKYIALLLILIAAAFVYKEPDGYRSVTLAILALAELCVMASLVPRYPKDWYMDADAANEPLDWPIGRKPYTGHPNLTKGESQELDRLEVLMTYHGADVRQDLQERRLFLRRKAGFPT